MINKLEKSILMDYKKLQKESDALQRKNQELKNNLLEIKKRYCDLVSQSNVDRKTKKWKEEKKAIEVLYNTYIRDCQEMKERQKEYAKEKRSLFQQLEISIWGSQDLKTFNTEKSNLLF